MRTRDEKIGKRAARRDQRQITLRVYVYLHLICNLFVIV